MAGWISQRYRVPAIHRRALTWTNESVGSSASTRDTGLPVEAWQPVVMSATDGSVVVYPMKGGTTWWVAARRNSGLTDITVDLHAEFVRR